MSTTTQILFNSPALNSLKREQLIKLCKIHSIKANGKNVDIIARLKQHATSLPPDAPLSLAVRSENIPDDEPSYDPGLRDTLRPSEQWEIVMGDIDESPESLSTNPINSPGGFETAVSNSSAMDSPIRSFASYLGLNKTMPKANSDQVPSTNLGDSLTSHAIPYSSLPDSPPPVTDHFILNNVNDAPLPGNPSLPGAPAPSDARLSLTNAVTSTTIRLVSMPWQSKEKFPTTPKLQPLKTSFEIIMESPLSSVPKWPASPTKHSDVASLYPTIPVDNLISLDQSSPAKMPGSLSPSSPEQTLPHSSSEPTAHVLSPSSSTMHPSFPLTSNTRSIPRSEPFIFGSPFPQHRRSNADFGKAAASVLEEMNTRLGLAGDKRVGLDIFTNRDKPLLTTAEQQPRKTDKFGFDKAHEKAFKKMDSITSRYAAKRANPNTRLLPEDVDGVVPGTKKRKSEALGPDAAVRPPETTKRANVIFGTGSGTKIPGSFSEEAEGDEEDQMLSKEPHISAEESSPHVKVDGEALRKSRQIDAVRRRAEARRRSSRVQGINTGLARQSIGQARTPIGAKTVNKATSSRFGFLSSAKKLVKSVWKGVGSNTDRTPKSTVPALRLVKPTPAKEKTGSTDGKAVTTKAPSLSVASKASVKQSSFDSLGTKSRFGFGFGGSSTVSKAAGSSSLGQKQRGSVNTIDIRVGSGTITSNTEGVSKRPSTLMAPTASSLAKMQGARLPKQSIYTSLQKKTEFPSTDGKPVLDTITNNHGTPSRIFNEPLTITTFSGPSKIPIPASVEPGSSTKSKLPRKPRISRTRVIAKLGAQRAAASAGSGKVRSSFGNGARRSYGGVKTRTSGGDDVLLNAKKKARANEFARRRSRVAQQKVAEVEN